MYNKLIHYFFHLPLLSYVRMCVHVACTAVVHVCVCVCVCMCVCA